MIWVFEAFAGIVGFCSALERVGGFKIIGWCEINKFAQKAYRILIDTGKECILSDILEKDAPSKYWLSEKAAMKIAREAEKKQSLNS